MVNCMKTTVEIADGVLSEAKRAALREGTSVRALIEEGLQKVLDDRRKKPRFRLRDASVAGKGLQPRVADGSWETVRDLIYKGRGA